LDGHGSQYTGIRDDAGLPESTRPYDLRHAFVTELLAEGVPLQEVSWLAGHSSTHFTADKYGHRLKRRDSAARSALESAFGEE
jgi:site-specific recombinase XerD